MKSIFLTLVLGLSCLNVYAIHKVKEGKWIFTRGDVLNGPRGGTSEGIPVKINKEVTKSWLAVRESNISSYERDRRAILALAGEFKATFEFMETVLLDTKLGFDIPYATWGTEIVKVVENKKDFIALQHILVMFFKHPETGNTIGPMVVKHWRQDWTWEPSEQLVFQGDNHWKIKKLNLNEGKGKWKWTVYQVDDTPRYSMLGSWTHLKSASMFNSGLFSRPLPRREFSVRSDYKLLLGNDTIVLTPNSWFHEQKNFKHKTKLGVDHARNESPLLSREIGHNSYLRLKGFDFSAGYDYWNKSKPYWDDVVSVWKNIMSETSDFQLKKSVDGVKLFQAHFKNAEDDKVLSMTSQKRKVFIRNLLNKYLK